MEITVAKRELLRLVSRMQSVADRKATMQALSTVLLTVDGPNAVRLSATDLYLSIVGRISAEVSKGGSIAIPAKELFERVKMMPDGPIHIATHDNSSTTLKAGGTARRYTLRGRPGEDFPPLPVPAEGAPTLALEVDILQELLEKTYIAVSTDETRPHLNSALFEWDGDIVRMVATDGHRLSKLEVKVEGRQASATMLIPLKAVHELRRLCEDVLADAPKDREMRPQLQITQSASSAFFQHGTTTFSVKLVDAQFPPYAQVIPQSSAKQIRAPRAALADALRAVSLSASERTGGVRFSLGRESLKVSSESPESGDGADEVAVDYTGEPMTIGFNAKYFLDILGVLDEDEIVLGLTGELDPAVVRPEGDRAFTAVVMPMRI